MRALWHWCSGIDNRVHEVTCHKSRLVITVTDPAIALEWELDSTILTGSHGWGCTHEQTGSPEGEPLIPQQHAGGGSTNSHIKQAPPAPKQAAPFYFFVEVSIALLSRPIVAELRDACWDSPI